MHPDPSPLATSPLFYLASQSPRRLELLAQVGLVPELLVPEDEAEREAAEALEQVLPREVPASYVQRVTRLKAIAAWDRCLRAGRPPAPILVADTTVALGREILGKPQDAADAARMLKRLSGRSHKVLTAVAVLTPDASQTDGYTIRSALNESRVQMIALSQQVITDYIATGEPFGKAGAYALQGQAARFIRRIVGSPSGIIGLPLEPTTRLLRHAGIPV